MRSTRKTCLPWALLSLGLGLASCRLRDAQETAEGLLGDGCVYNSDCEGDLVCIFDRCHEDCHTDEDCDGTERCVLGDENLNVCQLPDDTACETDLAPCQGAQVCAVDLECHDPCVSDTDCPHAQQRCDRHLVCVSTVGKDTVDVYGDLVPHSSVASSDSTTTSGTDTTTSGTDTATSGIDTTSSSSTSATTSTTTSWSTSETSGVDASTSSSVSPAESSTTLETSESTADEGDDGTESTESTSESGSSSSSGIVEPSGCPGAVELTFGEAVRGSTEDPGWDIDLSDWMDRSDVACDPFPEFFPAPYQVYAFDLPTYSVWDVVVTPDPGVDINLIAWRESLSDCLPAEQGSTLVCEAGRFGGPGEPESVFVTALQSPYRFGVLVTTPPEEEPGGYTIHLQLSE